MKRTLMVILVGVALIAPAFGQEQEEDKWEVGGGIQAVGSQRREGSQQEVGWVADVTRSLTSVHSRLAWMLEASGVSEPVDTTTVVVRNFPALSEFEVITAERKLSTYTAMTGPVWHVGGSTNVYVSCRGLTGTVIRSTGGRNVSNVAAKGGCGVAYAIERQLGARLDLSYMYLAGDGGNHVPVIGAGMFVRF